MKLDFIIKGMKRNYVLGCWELDGSKAIKETNGKYLRIFGQNHYGDFEPCYNKNNQIVFVETDEKPSHIHLLRLTLPEFFEAKIFEEHYKYMELVFQDDQNNMYILIDSTEDDIVLFWPNKEEGTWSVYKKDGITTFNNDSKCKETQELFSKREYLYNYAGYVLNDFPNL